MAEGGSDRRGRTVAWAAALLLVGAVAVSGADWLGRWANKAPLTGIETVSNGTGAAMLSPAVRRPVQVAGQGAAGAGGAVDRVSAATITAMLKDMTIEFDQRQDDEGDPALIMTLGKWKCVMLFYQKVKRTEEYSSLQIRGFFQVDPAASLDTINAWNRDRRFSKAYLDKDGDPTLEVDLDLTGGVTPENIRQWIRGYGTSLGNFAEHLNIK